MPQAPGDPTLSVGSRRPVMRQEFVNGAVLVRRQATQHILQIRIGIVAVELRRLDQTHDGDSGALATTQ